MSAPPPAGAASERLSPPSLFWDDPWNRLLGRMGLGSREHPHPFRRALALVLVTWAPLAALSWLWRPGFGAPGRQSFWFDVACLAQFVGYLPLATLAEPYIDDKMRTALRELRTVAPADALAALAARARRWSRTPVADLVCAVLAVVMTWNWAWEELANGQPSWHTFVVAGGERFTPAGWWVTLVSLPLFTYVWMRWLWKVAVWTGFLLRVSRLRLRLYPAHPDRTAGLGCLSEVQTSFAILVFAVSVLFAAFTWYKLKVDLTPLGARSLWIPIVGYVVLAPAVFLAPLFLFTATLYRTRRRALIRYNAAAAAESRRFERAWQLRSRRSEPSPEGLPSSQEAMAKAFAIVDGMRIVPFDVRSAVQLFSSAVGPFLPLLDALDLQENLKDLINGFFGLMG